MSNHTPRPWVIYSDDGDIIDIVNIDYFIADVHRIEPKDEWRANARLIAAAPDMLEALERIADMDVSGSGELAGDMRDVARAAIAKAKGGKT